MIYNFDELIDRHHTDCLKHDFYNERNKPKDAIPLWVADMDFRAPKEVIDALTTYTTQGIFGYSDIREDYFEAVHNWFFKRFGWDTRREWLITTPGVVFALNLAVRAFTKEGDAVLIQRPVYPAFTRVIEDNKRVLISNSLINKNGTYSIDFDDLEEKIRKYSIHLMLLCSPHNPGGRVWTVEELTRLGELCIKYDVILVTDEIHADLTLPGHKHTVMASIRKDFSDRIITCTAPSKTFNLAGLQTSNISIENEQIRNRFKQEMNTTCYHELNCLGILATKTAYTYGEEWLEQLLVYLKGNIDYIKDFLNTYLPKVKVMEPQGSYLLWLDFNAYGLSNDELDERMLHKAKLWLNPGIMFGKEGSGFERLNVASPRSVIEQAMHQLYEAFKEFE